MSKEDLRLREIGGQRWQDPPLIPEQRADVQENITWADVAAKCRETLEFIDERIKEIRDLDRQLARGLTEQERKGELNDFGRQLLEHWRTNTPDHLSDII